MLAEGTVYVRPRRVPESIPARTTADPRDLIHLASDIELREFLARATTRDGEVTATDTDRFHDQLTSSGPAQGLQRDLSGRGSWSLTVRPTVFDDTRVAHSDLEDVIRDCVVQSRGWDFPHIDQGAELERDTDWIGQGNAWHDNVEVWRIWTSGQFNSQRAFRFGWIDHPPGTSQPPDAAGSPLGVTAALISIWESYELAARLALSSAGGDHMRITLVAGGIAGRHLVMDDPERPAFHIAHVAADSEYTHVGTVPTAELIADPTTHAAGAAVQLFGRFGWTPGRSVIRRMLAAFQSQR